MSKVVIIGAGVGGMAVANMLAHQGYNVHVYEKNAAPGGRMGLMEKDGFRFDTGPSWYLMPEVFEHYFGLFNTKPTDYYDLVRLTPAYKVFYDYADPITITGDMNDAIATFAAHEPGSEKKLQRYIDQAEQTYHMALKYFLYNPFRSIAWVCNREIIMKSPQLAVRLLQPLHAYVQRYVQTKQLQQILEYPMVFLGASPYNAPSLYQLMSYLDFKQGVFYPKGGMYKITEALMGIGKDYKVTYHFNAPVEKILVENKNTVGVQVRGKRHDADTVISNADLLFTETQLLPVAAQTYPETYWQNRVAGPSALLIYLGVSGALPELEHHNLFFVDDWQENFAAIYDTKVWPEHPSMYVCKPSASDTTVAPAGHENVFVLVPLPAGVSKDDKACETYANMCIEKLGQVAGIDTFAQRIVTREIRDPQHFTDSFNSWQNTALGMSHTLKQSAMFRPPVKSKKLDNLYYVGAGTQPGIGVPMCLISAELVYKSIIGNTSAGPLRSLDIA